MFTLGNKSRFFDLVYLYLGPVGRLPRACRFGVDVVVFLDVFVVALVKVSVFFFSAAAVFDFCEDDLVSFDAPREFVTFFPVEVLEDVVRDFDEEVLRVIVLLNFSLKGVHSQSTIYV